MWQCIQTYIHSLSLLRRLSLSLSLSNTLSHTLSHTKFLIISGPQGTLTDTSFMALRVNPGAPTSQNCETSEDIWKKSESPKDPLQPFLGTCLSACRAVALDPYPA